MRRQFWTPPLHQGYFSSPSAFNIKQDLERHLKIHLEIKPFPCDTCDKRFASKANLVAHKRIHNSKRERVKCKYPGCNKTFSTKSNMITHFKKHSGEKPFQCQECLKKFTTKGAKKRHIDSIHKKLKPFACPVDGCKWAFAQKSDLKCHARTHNK